MAKLAAKTKKEEAPVAAEIVVDKNEKPIIFKAGDKVVYPPHGVGIIDSIEIRQVSGIQQRFYKITLLEKGDKVMAAVDRVRVIGLRKVIEPKAVEQVYDILRDRKITLDTQTWNRRFREYNQKIKTGSVLEIAKVIRDLSVLKGDKELSFGERRMLESAQGLLVQEISIAKSSSEEKVRKELETMCQVAA